MNVDVDVNVLAGWGVFAFAFAFARFERAGLYICVMMSVCSCWADGDSGRKGASSNVMTFMLEFGVFFFLARVWL